MACHQCGRPEYYLTTGARMEGLNTETSIPSAINAESDRFPHQVDRRPIVTEDISRSRYPVTDFRKSSHTSAGSRNRNPQLPKGKRKSCSVSVSHWSH